MKKIFALSMTLISLSTLVACGPSLPMRNFAAAPGVRSMSAAPSTGARPLNLTKQPSVNVKPGSSQLPVHQSKNQPKQIAPLTLSLNTAARDLPTSDVMTIARIGLDSMERARSYEDGYNIGRSTIDSLARQNSYIARLSQAATDPQMDYESAYKAEAHALTFIANNQQISISAACDLVRNMMGSAKSYEAGARIGYGTMAFIRQSASYSIQTVIDTSVRAAQYSSYFEDSYNTLYSAYGQIRYMN
ncbi:MAG: hypothetical protein ACAI44_21535 [Candidatus Sericytochromatia bacterium]